MEDDKPDLAVVLEHYDVQVRLGRRSQVVKCPFHEDRTPSCSVNLDKGVWNCHSCGEGGDVYTLIMKKEGTNFVGARTIAASLGLATGSSGGGDEHVSGSAYGQQRRVPARKGDRPSRSKYVPAWRRQ